MTATVFTRRVAVLASVVVVTATGCAFEGVNSVPLPGTEGRGAGAVVYHIKIANVGTLESNSPVMIDDVVVGSVDSMSVEEWHADVQVSVKPDVVVPANAVAKVGQTSLLGSMHLALDPPVGQSPAGRLAPGSTLSLERSSTYPSTEQTLSALSAVVNGGGLGQIGDIVHNFNAALSGRQDGIRDLISRLDEIIGIFADQRNEIVESIRQFNRLASTLAGQRDTITEALDRIPPALDVLIAEQPRFTVALDKLRSFSDTATDVIDNSHADLVTNLTNLEPTVKALADVGAELGPVLAYLPTYPYTQDLIDRGIKGDYLNFFAVLDFTVPRLKRGLFLGTRWGQQGAPLAPLPGEPAYLQYTYTDNPLTAGIDPPPDTGAPPIDPPAPVDAVVPPVDPPPPPLGPVPDAPPVSPQEGEG